MDRNIMKAGEILKAHGWNADFSGIFADFSISFFESHYARRNNVMKMNN